MKISYTLGALVIGILCSLHVYADAPTRPTVFNPGIMASVISDNGNYAISSSMGDQEVDNPHGAGGTLIDLRTHTTTKIDAPSNWAEVCDVADDGTVVGGALGQPGYWSPVTKEWTTFSVPADYGGGCFTAVTPDARLAVGYFTDPVDIYKVAPMMYDLTTGTCCETPNLPQYDRDGENKLQNVFYGITPDGRYILGQMSQSYWMPAALFTYVYDTTDSTWRPIGFDYDEATHVFTPQHPNLLFTSNQFMGAQGLWVTGSAYMVFNGGEIVGGSEGFYPYRYNIADGTFDVYDSVYDMNVSGNKITADGTMLASAPSDNPYPTAYIRTGKYFVSLDQIIQQVYGMSVHSLIGDIVTGSFQSLSADGLTALMSTYDNTYFITMPEPFAEAAAKVDLLANYTLNIPDGATINRISEIKLTFDRSVDCNSQMSQDIKLTDADGNVIRSAAGLNIDLTNDHTAVITFRSTALTPGAKYNVTIPAALIWLKDDSSVKTKEITLNYTGRDEGPIQLKSMSPASGAAVAEFNAGSDNLVLTFDTPVAISNTARCDLYDVTDDAYITSFAAIADGNRAIFYPTVAYNLYKGTEYRITVAAGSVTDLSGGGGNEEIVVDYHGAYVRELSADDIYIFNANCDNYDNFIFWEGDHNTPGAKPQSWGFSQDTPWVLVADNESATDMALAAHSMFAQPGQSDDWLITPQLYIPDANTYLAFDAQSYMRSRNDVLKVIIYSTDAVFNYFSNDLEATFLADGDVVFEETISAGDSDEGLEGEWTRCVVPLDKYVDRNIYIAFINSNYDQSAIFLNDVQVIRNMDFLVTNQTPIAVVDAADVKVSGLVTIGSEVDTFHGISVSLVLSDGTVIDTVSDESVELSGGDDFRFTFSKALPLTVGTETEYRLIVSSGTTSSVYYYSIKDLAFEPVKRVVLEEFSGSSCSNCPLGIVAVENLLNLYPDNFIPLVLRSYNNDMYAAGSASYAAFLGFNAAPSGRINRGSIIMPMVHAGSAGYQFNGRGIIMSDGTEAYVWADAVQDELSVPAEAEITFTASYDHETGSLSVPCDIRFALDRKAASIGVFGVVVEDNLPTYQLNGMSSISDPNLGDWGVGGKYGTATVASWQVSEVVRHVINGPYFNGTTMPESTFIAGETYPMHLSTDIQSDALRNPDNCHVVVMLIDRATGRIINANKARFTYTSIDDVMADDDAEPEYYNLQGIRIVNPEPGHIYIKVTGTKATKVRF